MGDTRHHPERHNTFRNSHRVDKRHMLTQDAYGIAVMLGRWTFAVEGCHSACEFYGRRQSPVFGSFSASGMH